MKVLLTGCAGFIGFHCAKALLDRGACVIGVDSFTGFYDPALKEARAAILRSYPHFSLHRGDAAEGEFLNTIFDQEKPDAFLHLAAQAGVRESRLQPEPYTHSNIRGFMTVLEACRIHQIPKLVYASSSSVYGNGGGAGQPFREDDSLPEASSWYAATKQMNETMAHDYARLFGLRVCGLRFFTVYGAWGRPDMAYFLFADTIATDQEVPLYAGGTLQRDFTAIEDITPAVLRALELDFEDEIFNLGNNKPRKVKDMADILARIMNKKYTQENIPAPEGEVSITYADIEKARTLLGFEPQTSLEEGLEHFIAWHRQWRGKTKKYTQR